MEAKIRVRIAPSPTGIPHIGNTRTAFFNWLFAKKNNGKFIVRIEDTDRERYVPESLTAILEILKWLGLTWDEGPEVDGKYGPYIQSERLDIYKKYAHELIKKNHAYYCFCAPERLDQMHKDQETKHLPPKYDRHCRSLQEREITNMLKQRLPYAIRLKVPDEGKSQWDDLILGHISFENKVIDDQVLLKSDGYPTYHLGVVVDDFLMKITHVLRGSEWTSSTPKHILLYEFFGWEKPLWGHLPVILGPDKAKLSKRHGANSALWYRDQGYLPEALLNAIALWGWVPKTGSELLTKEEMVNLFDLKDVTITNPIFNPTKIDWFNGQYIRKTTSEELFELLKPFLQDDAEIEMVRKIIPLVQDRLVKLSDWKDLTDFFFIVPEHYNEQLLLQTHEKSEVKDVLEKGINLLGQLKYPWNHDEWEKRIRNLADEYKWKHADVFQIFRVALTGRTATPPLFEMMMVLGAKEVETRLKKALGFL
jgi:glutamyl-tRNA synthetase